MFIERLSSAVVQSVSRCGRRLRGEYSVAAGVVSNCVEHPITAKHFLGHFFFPFIMDKTVK